MAIDSKLAVLILDSNTFSSGPCKYSPIQGVMFNIKSTYWKISVFTQNFQSSRVMQNVLKTQDKCNTDEILITS